MFQCPHPGCKHTAAYIILNSHAKTHGFTNMTELSKKYGRVRKIQASSEVSKWASQNSHSVTKYQFDGAEACASRLKQHDKKNRT